MYEVPQKKCRLKGSKPSMKNKPKITAEEKEYLQWLQEQTVMCFQCGTYKNIEWHHIKEYSHDKKNHTELMPLCKYHHTGHTLSPHGTPRQWRNMYPMKVQRLQAKLYYSAFQQEILNRA